MDPVATQAKQCNGYIFEGGTERPPKRRRIDTANRGASEANITVASKHVVCHHHQQQPGGSTYDSDFQSLRSQQNRRQSWDFNCTDLNQTFLQAQDNRTEIPVNGSTDKGTDEKEQSRRQVCFGMVNQTNCPSTICLLSKIAFELSDWRADSQHAGGRHESSRTIFNEADSTFLGHLSDTEATILQTFLADPQIELQMRSLIGTPFRVSAKPSQPQSATLCVVIYGAFHLFEDVGQFLEDEKVYLQDPIGCNRIVEYRNPHRLSSLDEEVVMTSMDMAACPNVSECVTEVADLLSGFENGESLPEEKDPVQLLTQLHKLVILPTCSIS